MRWLTFAIFAGMFLVLETGLRTLWSVGRGGHCPELLLILAVFVALAAPPSTASWAALLLGLLLDLTQPLSVPHLEKEQSFVLLGPNALGFLAAARVTLELRGLIFRHSPAALAVMVVVAGAFAHLVTVALLTMRGLAWNPADAIGGWSAADQLLGRCFDLLYTAAVAVPVGIALRRVDSWWGFGAHGGGGPSRFRRGA